MKFGVVVFPGSNCDDDALQCARRVMGQEAEFVWHDSEDLLGADVVILPGGFAHGDYLRTGAIARFSPVMRAVRRFAASGGLVMGICNGFQILLEAGLLPGAMRPNAGLKYVCKPVRLRVENDKTPFTGACRRGQVLTIPIGHGEGNYYADAETLCELRGRGQVLFRYLENPNGSLDDIAGICNREGNVMGMMPHPERAADPLLAATAGSSDGQFVFRSLVQAFEAAAARS
jgi:phosphoribosylformylglycinamidine synthase